MSSFKRLSERIFVGQIEIRDDGTHRDSILFRLEIKRRDRSTGVFPNRIFRDPRCESIGSAHFHTLVYVKHAKERQAAVHR